MNICCQRDGKSLFGWPSETPCYLLNLPLHLAGSMLYAPPDTDRLTLAHFLPVTWHGGEFLRPSVIHLSVYAAEKPGATAFRHSEQRILPCQEEILRREGRASE